MLKFKENTDDGVVLLCLECGGNVKIVNRGSGYTECILCGGNSTVEELYDYVTMGRT